MAVVELKKYPKLTHFGRHEALPFITSRTNHFNSKKCTCLRPTVYIDTISTRRKGSVSGSVSWRDSAEGTSAQWEFSACQCHTGEKMTTEKGVLLTARAQ